MYVYIHIIIYIYIYIYVYINAKAVASSAERFVNKCVDMCGDLDIVLMQI
jgi:hypothetical protein